MYKKRIVCLANSRKMKGRCIAGREIVGEEMAGWIRPVSSRPNCEVSLEEMRLNHRTEPQLLDILEITMVEPRPHGYQTENHLFDSRSGWQKVGNFPPDRIQEIVEAMPTLWLNGSSSSNGVNDRILVETAERELRSSLALIIPERLTIDVGREGLRGAERRKVRCTFRHRGVSYCLVVTDPIAANQYLRQGDGSHHAEGQSALCVSLGEPFEGYSYKLVAGIIPLE